MSTLSEIYAARAADGTLRPDPAQKAVLPALESLRRWLEETEAKPKGLFGGLFRKAPPAPPKGLYVWGGVGRGKSMLMDLFVDNTAIAGKRRIHFHAFMQEIHHAMHEVRKTGAEDALAPVAAKVASQLRLLAFDEMQITDITDAMIVGRLFKLLTEAGVVIVTTSNRVPGDLYKNGLNRALFVPFIGWIEQNFEVHHLESPNDYRQHRLAGAQVYFAPDDAQARAALQGYWSDLTGGAAGEQLALQVNGRELVLDQVASGVALSSFDALCKQPLGPGDYLAIAESVRVLILSGIPRLSRANNNEAKRFVTLIDALYEAKVRLIASAADIPEKLYETGEGAFEFERTASRLREMQDAAWGAEEA